MKEKTGLSSPWLKLVNLGMIWCFGFFFLELYDDLDEGSQERLEALLALNRLCVFVFVFIVPLAVITITITVSVMPEGHNNSGKHRVSDQS